jgi:hypothetical protein
MGISDIPWVYQVIKHTEQRSAGDEVLSEDSAKIKVSQLF